MTPSTPKNRTGGFTLVELLVVMIVLGLLAALVLPKLGGVSESARRDTASIQIKALEDALEQFQVENGFYPTTEQGLEALVTKPSGGREALRYREGGYLKKVPKDPWNNPYVYLSPGVHGAFDLMSYGADGVPGGEGGDADISNWEGQ